MSKRVMKKNENNGKKSMGGKCNLERYLHLATVRISIKNATRALPMTCD